MLRVAIAVRLDLVIAICMATLNGAENYRLYEREIVTRHWVESVKVSGSLAIPDVARDLLKIAVLSGTLPPAGLVWDFCMAWA